MTSTMATSFEDLCVMELPLTIDAVARCAIKRVRVLAIDLRQQFENPFYNTKKRKLF